MALFWACFWGWAPEARADYSGVTTSPVFDMGKGTPGTISWAEEIPTGTGIVVEARAGESATPDAGWTGWSVLANGGSLGAFAGKKNLQYRATLSSDGTAEPSIGNIVISFTGGVLRSSVYDSEDSTAAIDALLWTESISGASDVNFQLRTSPDGSAWTPWCGPDDGVPGSCTSTTYFTDPSGTETVDDLLGDGSGDRYIQYAAFYASDGSFTPSVSAVDIRYVTDPTRTRAYAGTFASQVIDLGQKSPLSFSWNSTVPVGTSLSMRLRAGTTRTPDTGWTAWTAVTNGQDIGAYAGKEYFQYEATLSSDGRNEPSLADVTIAVAGGFVVSSPYDSEDTTNVLNRLTWAETKPGASDVTFQLRTSPDGSTWTPWCGPDDGVAGSCTSTAYFTDPSGAETVDDLLRDGSGDKYVQYKVLYAADGANLPAVGSIDLHYAVNQAAVRAYAGTFASQVIDLGQKSPLTFGWSESVPVGTSLTMRLRAGTTRAPDASWTAWTAIANGADISSYAGKEYFQYEAILSSDGYYEPSIADVTLLSSGGYLISSPYDTEDTTDVPASLKWTETLPAGTDVVYQLRTSPDGSTWTPWCGPDDGVAGSCTSTTYFTDPSGGERIDDLLSDADNDRYIQYKALLSTSGANLPSATGIDIHYQVDDAAIRTYAGTFTSQVLDLGQKTPFSFDWTDAVPVGTSLTMRLRAGTTRTPDANWTAWTAATKGMDLSSYAGKEYFQYEAALSSDGRYEPSLTQAVFAFNGGYLISSPYNTEDTTLVVNRLTWTETKPGASDVTFQLRTSPDGSTWTPWCGPDDGVAGSCTSTAYFTDPSGAETVDDLLRDGSGDKYVQYKVLYAADGANLPAVGSIDLHYAVNPAAVRAYAGIYYSPVLEGGMNADYTTINWTDSVPIGTSLVLKLRAGSTSVPDGTWTSWAVMTKNQSLDAYDNKRYFQYEADLSSDGVYEPSLGDIAINLQDFLISNPYNAQNAALVVSKLTWTENPADNAGGIVRFQLSTSPDGSTWTPWCGPDNGGAGCDSATFFTDPEGREVVDDMFTDGVDDQYLRYKVMFNDVVAIPSVSDIDIQYVANTPPVVASVVADQAASGIVNVTYAMRDADDSQVTVSLLADTGAVLDEELTAVDQSAITVAVIAQLPAAGTIQLDDEEIAYAGKLGNDLTGLTRGVNNTRARAHAGGTTVWLKGTHITGDAGSGVAIGTTLADKAAAWDIRQDFAVYTDAARVRVNLNDGNGAYQIGRADSASFLLDTKPPLLTALHIDGRAASGNIALALSDDTAFEMKYSTTQADLDNQALAYAPYATTATVNLDGHHIVYFRFKDAKGNLTDHTLSLPAQSTSSLIQDVSNLDTGEYRLFFSFTPIAAPALGFDAYHIYAAESESGSFTERETQDKATLNYYMDPTLAEGGTRYYKVAASDQAGNYSEYSPVAYGVANGLLDGGEGNGGSGGGGSASDPPVITHDPATQVTGLTGSGATIAFTTDQNSDSDILFSVCDGVNPPSYDREQGVPTFILPNQPHSVVLVGLLDGTRYCYKLVARNADGAAGTLENAATQYFVTDTDTTAPVLSYDPATQLTEVTATGATFSFTTDEPATTGLDYGKTAAYGSTAADSHLDLSHHFALTGLEPGTTYHYRLQATDGSASRNRSESIDYAFTTLALPVITFDEGTGISELAATRVRLSFTTDIAANSLVDYSDAAGVFTSTQGNYLDSTQNHIVVLNGLRPETAYHFRLRAVSAAGYEGVAEGGGQGYNFTTLASSDKQAPAVSAVAVSVGSATTATVTWTTDEPASSLVDFGTSLAFGRTQGSAAELVTAHSVALTGLTPATAYVLRVKSADENGNLRIEDNSSRGYGFTTEAAPVPAEGEEADTIAPVITFNPASGISDITPSGATIAWTTDEPADSVVGYGLGTSFAQEQGSGALVTSHVVNLGHLSPGVQYRLRLKSQDAAGNLRISDNGGTGYSFTTLSGIDRTPAVIGAVAVSEVTGSGATVTWTTDENANSLVEYGLTAGSFDSVAGNYTDAAVEHSVAISGLGPLTKYYYRVRSADASGNQSLDSGSATPYTFTTLAKEDTCPVYSGGGGSSRDTTAPALSELKVADVNASGATISWTTSEGGYSMVEFDTDKAYANSVFWGNPKKMETLHVVKLDGLKPDTVYRVRALSADASGNLAQSSDLVVTTPKSGTLAEDQTELKAEAEEKIRALTASGLSEEEIRDVISGSAPAVRITSDVPKVSDITNSSARISWLTDKKANSVVRFRARGALNEKEFGNFSDLLTEHAVLISGLESGIAYEYQVQSSDALGATSRSDWSAFATSITPSIYDVAVSDVSLSSATVEWKTSMPSSDLLEYGTDISYEKRYEGRADARANVHLVKLSGLASGASYHYRIKGVDQSGEVLASADYTFNTYTLPKIDSYSIGAVGEREAALRWLSNVETDANVRYTDVLTGQTRTQGDAKLLKVHEFGLKNLEPGKDYVVQLLGRDSYGNQAASVPFALKTSADTTAPVFGRVSIETAVASGKGQQVRTIISYVTTEPSSTRVFYQQGSSGSGYDKSTPADDNLTTNHVVVITDFRPATVYRFRLQARDASGNEASSKDFTVLVPEEKKSVIQMITSNFESTFGWLKKLGG